MKIARFIVVPCWLALLGSCVGETGGRRIGFDAYAAGPADAPEGQSLSFTSGRGYAVTLTRARVHVGAVYLNQSEQTSVGQDTSCTLPGIYCAEVTTGLEVDALSPALQKFPERGDATSDRARTGEVWLTGGDINEVHDETVLLDVAGTAERDGESYPFEGRITISDNRVIPPDSEALPGSGPICKERVVTPIPVNLVPTAGGSLVVRIDPRGFFTNVEFSSLELVSTSPQLYRFADDSSNQPSANLYNGLRASIGVYALSWERVEP